MKALTNIKKIANTFSFSISSVISSEYQAAWTEGIIPYATDANADVMEKVIAPAMALISQRYNVCFVPRTTEIDYINLTIAHCDPLDPSCHKTGYSNGKYGKSGGKQDLQATVFYRQAITNIDPFLPTSISILRNALLYNAGIYVGNNSFYKSADTLYPKRVAFENN